MDLFTVVILCYRNFEYLRQAIDSVLCQDYPQIELIVSDDCSQGFPQKELQEYIEKRKKSNICSVLVRQEEKNSGTVRHLNHNAQLAKGKYIAFLAADDIFASEGVLSEYAQGLENAAEPYPLAMAQTAMYDQTLTKFEEYYMSRAVQQILEKGDHEALGRRLSYSACLPTTSTCYTRLFFEKYGYFDENYVLIEDYPVHLRIVQEKIPVLYENFVAIHHRSGGISHGATKALSASKRQYFRDIVGCHEQVLQGLKKEKTKFSKAVRDEFRHQKIWLDYQIFWRSPSWAEKLKLPLLHPAYSLLTGLRVASGLFFKQVCLMLLACICGLIALPFLDRAVEILWGLSLVPVLPAIRMLFRCLIVFLIFLGGLYIVGTVIGRLERDPFASQQEGE